MIRASLSSGTGGAQAARAALLAAWRPAGGGDDDGDHCAKTPFKTPCAAVKTPASQLALRLANSRTPSFKTPAPAREGEEALYPIHVAVRAGLVAVVDALLAALRKAVQRPLFSTDRIGATRGE